MNLCEAKFFNHLNSVMVEYFRLYSESITYLRDSITVKLFYLQAIQSMYKVREYHL